MDYDIIGNKVRIRNCRQLHVGQTLECGQCFRFTRKVFSEEFKDEYTIIAHGRVLHLASDGDTVSLYPCTREEFEEIWFDYFDLGTDYAEIVESFDDPVVREAAAFAPGIRILNQEPWECLISFIISQNKSIPGIQQVIQNIAVKYGKPLDGAYAFPSPTELRQATKEELRQCKAGFRDRYILSAIEMTLDKRVDFDQLIALDTEGAKKMLMSVPGVGPKVSDCVLLFSLKHREVFPTDVWVKRVMQHFYFGGRDVPIGEIHSLAKEKFGAYAGFAQQYLFHYARQHKIGV